MQKNLLSIFSALTFTLLTTIGSAQGTFDVRFLIDSVDCANSKLFVDIQVRADNPGQEYFLGDQNYRFSFNRNVLANPQLVQEQDVSGYIPGGPGPLGFSFYSTHTLTGSLDTIVSYNLELQGGDGLFVTDTDYLNVGRVSLDVLDFNTPVCLRWHRNVPEDFPNTFVGQKLNGSLVPTDEGSYLDYYQDLSSACSNTTPVATDDVDTTLEEQPITVCLPDNDTDAENALDNMSVTLLSTPPAAEGAVTLDATTGCITFTPAADFVGTVTAFDYEICDLGVQIPSYQGDTNPLPVPAPDPGDPPIDAQPPACTTATINLTVTNVNDAPVAMDDTETTPEDTPLNSDVTPNDSDVDMDNLTVNTTPVTPPANGTLTLNADGTYTYTPNPNYFGPDSFVYEICDDGTPSLCAQATVNIDVTPVNDAPIAEDDTETTQEEVPVNSDVTPNDTEPDGDNLVVNTTPVLAPTNGTLTLNADGTYTYIPAVNFSGTDSFTYEVCDDVVPALCDLATVTITIDPVNDAPVAIDDSETTDEDTPLSSDVTPNDSDVDPGDVLTVNTTPVTPPANGALVLNADGTYTYTPNADFNGTDSFVYEICDDGTPQLCAEATVTITVDPVNDAPIAEDDTETTPEDTPISSDVSPNDSDIDMDPLTVTTTPVAPPSNGTVVINTDGTYTYTPNADFNGTDSFEYEICDNGSPALCDNAVVTITIDPANDAPVAADDTETTDEDTPLNSDVTPNDSDVDMDNLTVTTTPVTPPSNGTLTLNADGTYTYTPNADFNGTDSFEYEICDDGTPSLCATAVVNITIDPVNDAPVAVDDTETTSEDTPVSSDVSPNDSDVDGDPLTVTTTPVTPPANGTVILNTDGTYTYTPNADYTGTDSFVYEICDDGAPQLCAQATVTITIDPVNDAPVAVDDSNTTPEDTPVSGDVSPNDSDIDGDNLTVNTTPTAAPTNGSVILNPDGTYTYTPNQDFNGSDSFRYEICDDGTPQLCAEATVTITVDPVNDAPVAVDDFGTTPEDIPFNGSTVLSNDTDVDTGDVLTVNTTPVSTPANGAVVINPDGTFVYTPNAGFNGSDTFEYEVCDDGTPQLCDIGMVTVTIDNVNDQPTALDDTDTTPEDTPLSGVSVLGNDTDIDGNNLTITTTPVTDVTNGTLVINPDGTFDYTPNQDFNGTDSFEYEVCDDGLNPATLCDTATVVITVTPVNDAPIAVDDSGTTQEDVPLTGTTVLANDSDVDTGDVLTTTVSTPPANGTVVVNPDGTYTYTPNQDFNGADSFVYEVCDNGTPIECATATVNITVEPLNDAPVAVDDAETTPEDTPLNSDVTPNDSDVDGDNLTVTTTPVTDVANGTLMLNADGTYTYTPNSDYFGTDSFVYEICDNGTPQECATATVTIDITSVNDAPIAVDDAETTPEDTPISSDVTPNDSDVDVADNLTVTTTPVVDVANGTLVLNGDGTYTYTPNPEFFGTDSFTYEICDDGTPVECATAVVTIDVTSVNDQPLAVDDAETTPEDTPVTVDVLVNDSDADTADNLTVTTTPVTPPANGTVALTPGGPATYTPNPDFFGTDTFEYEVCDDGSPILCDVATVTITVTPVNDAPVAVDDSETTDENMPLSSDVTPNDSDVDNDPLTVNTTPLVDVMNGTLVLNADGTYTYSPNAGYSGLDMFEYEICDNGTPALCDIATVTISIGAVNDPPIAVDDTATTPEDTPLNGASVLGNDSDIDTGDILTVTTTPVVDVMNGTLVLNADGTYIYTPNPNFFGTDTFEYEVCDNGDPILCSTATVTITVDSVNDAPVAVDDAETTAEDTPVTSDVLPNDSDSDTADALAVTATPVTPPANGAVTLAANGTYTYTPNPGFFGTDTFEYEVCDNGTPVLCDMATVTITVTSVNDKPVAVDDAETTMEDVAINSDVTPNDSDADVADMLTVNTTPVTAPANGTLTLNADGTYTYTPNANYFGADSFEYEICDNGSPVLCDTALVDITIDSVNDAPVALDDSETTTENTPLASDVTPNDTDVDVGDVLTVTTTPVVAPANGSLVLNPDGTYTYTPNNNYNGLDSFEYEICDNGTPQLCDTAIVTIGVGAVNDPPIAVNDSETTPEDVPINSDVLSNDSDIDVGDVLTVTTTPVVDVMNGTLILNGDGTYTYTPNPNYFGTDSFTYQVCDNGTPVLCSTAVVDITIESVNDAPVAVDDAETTLEDVPVSSDVTPNDSDVDVADVLTVNTTPVTPPANGSLMLNADGTYTYTPNASFFGTDSFVYEICDNGTPVECATATVTITVDPDNDAPVAVDDMEMTPEDTPLSSDVTVNDSDLDGDNLIVNTTPVADVSNGTLVLNADGTFTYTPNSDFFGTDSFEYEVCDDGIPSFCTTAVVTIDVTSVNDAPVAVDDAETTLEDVPVSSDVTPNDSDVDVADVLTVNTTPVTPPANGSLVLNADGTYTYTPNASFFGTDSFVYEICDNGTPVECATATVTITVESDNDVPVAVDDAESTPEDTPLSSDVTPNDSDIDGDNLTVTTTPVTDVANGTLMLNADGTFTYTPNPDFFGTDSFEYEICDDGAPVLCATATVTIDVTPVNDAPIAEDDTETTLEDVPLTSDVSPNDSDIETAAMTYTTVTGPTNGNLVLNSDGTYTYTPLPSFFGTDMFTYEACDGGTPILCDEATVFITIEPDNDAPIAKNDIGITNEDTPLSSTLAANDSEPDGENLIYTATPVNGPSDGTVIINPDGTYTYTPDLNFNGIDNFTYEVCDDGVPQLCSEAVATIRVNAVNDAPDLGDDAAVTDELVPVDIDVVANDSDVEDGAIDPCSVTIMTPPLGGTVTFSPAPACVMTYTPNPGFSGVDAFEYEVCDANGSCSTAIVDVTVNVICLDVQLAVWLEGALSDLENGYTPTMRTTLSDTRMLLPGQSNSTLPAGQPYNVAPWNYPGTEGAGWTDADYASVALAKGAGIVDWIMVSFRTDITSNTTFQRAAALVFEDGSVVFPEPCVLTVSAPSSFYIVIEHRNHMGVMSHIPVSASGGQVNYDFRTQDSWVNGTSFGQVEVEPGKFAMYGGDGEQIPDVFSYDINAVDKTTWLAENGIFGQYLYTDFNLDGDTNGGDKIIWVRNNGIASGVPK